MPNLFTSNLEILQRLKGLYNPKTAFGNFELRQLLDSIHEPNQDGKFETVASNFEHRIIRVEWKCLDCGVKNITKDSFEYHNIDDVINETCSCGKEHELTITE